MLEHDAAKIRICLKEIQEVCMKQNVGLESCKGCPLKKNNQSEGLCRIKYFGEDVPGWRV